MKATLLALLASCAGAKPADVVVPADGGPPRAGLQIALERTIYLSGSGCSAVALGKDRLVTARHCLPDDGKAGDAYEGGEVLFISPSHDFAIVKFPDPRPAVLRRNAVVGEHLWVVGYPMQLGSEEQDLTVTDGILAGPVDAAGQQRITAPVYFGNSGGGVWSDRGELLGIAVSIYAARLDGAYPMPYAAQSFMVPVALLRESL